MKLIITGVTGYVGEGIMRSCLEDSRVEKVLAVCRKPLIESLRQSGKPVAGIEKLEEYIVPDFMDLKAGDEKLQGYDAVYFCAGISSVGISMDRYKVICQDIPLHFAEVVGPKENMIFTYLSGYGTSDKNPQEWAKIKSCTEAELSKLPFKAVYWYRPCFMLPHPGQVFRKSFQVATRIIYPLAWLFGMGNTIRDVARSMMALTGVPSMGPYGPVIGVKEIKQTNN